MKFFVVLAVILGSTSAQQYTGALNGNEIVITRSENENSGDGTFRWLSELSDGTKLEQSGYVKDGPDPEHAIQVIQGGFSYISPEGQQINLQYVADENGFRPIGDHIPAAPRSAVPYTATQQTQQFKPRPQTQQYQQQQPIRQTPVRQQNQQYQPAIEQNQPYQSSIEQTQQYQPAVQQTQQFQQDLQRNQPYQPRPAAPTQRYQQQPRRFQ